MFTNFGLYSSDLTSNFGLITTCYYVKLTLRVFKIEVFTNPNFDRKVYLVLAITFVT